MLKCLTALQYLWCWSSRHPSEIREYLIALLQMAKRGLQRWQCKFSKYYKYYIQTIWFIDHKDICHSSQWLTIPTLHPVADTIVLCISCHVPVVSPASTVSSSRNWHIVEPPYLWGSVPSIPMMLKSMDYNKCYYNRKCYTQHGLWFPLMTSFGNYTMEIYFSLFSC